MNKYTITKDDIKQRIYFITKLVQNQTGSTMQGALTSKSDSMGGIFDRFINTLSDSLIFDKIIFQKPVFTATGKKIKAVEDFYYYKPSNNGAGIAPDIFGVEVDGVIHPFTVFNEKWTPIPGMPQIEVKTFKAKDQMISLRNQNYDGEYLVLADLDMRIDYLVPFLDKSYLSNLVKDSMKMDDSVFIENDPKHMIDRISEIDFDSNEIGTLSLISITNATDFMSQATLCEGNISVCRMKEINKRKVKMRNGLLHDKLTAYSSVSPRISRLYEFNDAWKKKMSISSKTKCLDFEATNIDDIEICKYNTNGIVITPLKPDCSFNGMELTVGEQYTVNFDTLDRSGNDGSEYFMQKQCACYLKGLEHELTKELLSIINK